MTSNQVHLLYCLCLSGILEGKLSAGSVLYLHTVLAKINPVIFEMASSSLSSLVL